MCESNEKDINDANQDLNMNGMDLYKTNELMKLNNVKISHCNLFYLPETIVNVLIDFVME